MFEKCKFHCTTLSSNVEFKFKITALSSKVEFKFKNISIDVVLKDVHYCGKCKIVVELDESKSFPCVNRVFITLMERPKVCE